MNNNLTLNITKEEFLRLWNAIEEVLMDNVEDSEDMADILVEKGVIKA